MVGEGRVNSQVGICYLGARSGPGGWLLIRGAANPSSFRSGKGKGAQQDSGPSFLPGRCQPVEFPKRQGKRGAARQRSFLPSGIFSVLFPSSRRGTSSRLHNRDKAGWAPRPDRGGTKQKAAGGRSGLTETGQTGSSNHERGSSRRRAGDNHGGNGQGAQQQPSPRTARRGKAPGLARESRSSKAARQGARATGKPQPTAPADGAPEAKRQAGGSSPTTGGRDRATGAKTARRHQGTRANHEPPPETNHRRPKTREGDRSGRRAQQRAARRPAPGRRPGRRQQRHNDQAGQPGRGPPRAQLRSGQGARSRSAQTNAQRTRQRGPGTKSHRRARSRGTPTQPQGQRQRQTDRQTGRPADRRGRRKGKRSGRRKPQG